jgi:hypothetical protein
MINVRDELPVRKLSDQGPYHPVLRPVRIPANGGPAADSAFAAAIVGLCQHPTPYHPALSLLDHAEISATWTVTRRPGP